MHLVVEPLAVVSLGVGPFVHTGTVLEAFFKGTRVDRSVSKGLLSLAALLTFGVVTSVFATVAKDLFALAVLLVIFPLADVLATIRVGIRAPSVCLVFGKVAFVGVSVSMVQLSVPVGHIFRPLTNVA